MSRRGTANIIELYFENLIPSIPSFQTISNLHKPEDNVSAATSRFSSEEEYYELLQAVNFLHRDNEFLIAAEMGDENTLRVLIEQGTNIQQVDHLGRNALHWACINSSGNQTTLRLLLEAGVKPDVTDHLGMTPLSLCLERSPSYQMAALLLDHGAIIKPRERPTDTGLFLQFVMVCIPTPEEEKILRLLVSRGVPVNDPEAPGGRQALHVAAMANNTRLVNILVDLGADLHAVNHRNETPMQVAETFACREAYALLERIEDLCSVMERPDSVLEFEVEAIN